MSLAITRTLQRALRAPSAIFGQPSRRVKWHPLGSEGEYLAFARSKARLLARQREFERAYAETGLEAFQATCYTCHTSSSLAVDYTYAYEVDGRLVPNWREQLACPTCGLNNRMRAAMHLLEEVVKPKCDATMLLAEEVTPIARWLHGRYPAVIGCEYLGNDVPVGSLDTRGVRNEDFTRLTFSDDQFDLVLMFDICEHIPGYESALAECWRVLKPGGALLFSVPFNFEMRDHLVRARVTADGSIEYLLEPEYHGDPLTTAGCLAYYQFGWRLLDNLLQVGFQKPRLYTYWSAEFGYLGSHQALFYAQHPE